MKTRKFGLALSLVLATGTILAACGEEKKEVAQTPATPETPATEAPSFKVAMVTDVGGVDDKSFNQSAWEGLKEFGAANGLTEGKDGFTYLQSQSDADYSTNLNTLAREGFNLVFGVGYLFETDMSTIADQQKETKFAIIDGTVVKDNVVSVLFKEQEAAFLAGVAAAKQTKAEKIGFIGGMEIPVIERFEAGFIAGVKSVNPALEVVPNYTGAFDKAELGKTAANSMYSQGIDVIFHAAGGTGNGLFSEAKDLKKMDPTREIWAIGVDTDQSAEGIVKVGDTEYNVILTSAMKGVHHATVAVSELAMKGEFPGGQTLIYGLAEEGVNLAPVNEASAVKADIEAAVADYTKKIVSGEIVVPGTLEELEAFLGN